MSKASLKGVIPSAPAPITGRPLTDLPADMAAVKALAQGAINVELFTLPLYMCAMQSIQGTHEINAQGISYYKGRVWPGMSATAGGKLTSNQKAYNIMFSVFIQEMLHLQLAANLATVLGAKPLFFNGTILQNKNLGWGCYSADATVIPHIIDLLDTTNASKVKVNLDGLTADQLILFTAIEQSDETARNNIKPAARSKYFPEVPFANWTAESTEADLPMFGTIGWMYHCLLSYLTIEYSDKSTLWERMFNSSAIFNQRDLYNYVENPGHPGREYPGMPARITSGEPAWAALEAIDIVKGICDQGEGGAIASLDSFQKLFLARTKTAGVKKVGSIVQPQFQPDKAALKADYPSYTSGGETARASAQADARASGDVIDHWQRFENLKKVIQEKDFSTWSDWFKAGNSWKEADLVTKDYDPKTAPANIPKPAEVAAALNKLKKSSPKDLNLVVTGAISGITSVLSDSWGDVNVSFPYPSMSGSGDRMSLFWAVYGVAPSLAKGAPLPKDKVLYHACQGLDYSKPGAGSAAIEVYHTCRGSNSCKAQGGCGFAQLEKGGGGCGAMRTSDAKLHAGNLCSQPSRCSQPGKENYTAPNDNKCKSFGGCAVPISASQLYPTAGNMVLQNVVTDAQPSLGNLAFKVGDSVYDTAWAAYTKVMQANKKKPGDKPSPSPLRVALPPST